MSTAEPSLARNISDFSALAKHMPRYHFDVREGDQLIVDDDGFDLSTPELAWAEAARAAAEIARDAISKRGGVNHQISIHVRERQIPLLSVMVSFETEHHKK